MSWPLVKLDDIATLLRGVTFSSDDSVGQSCENYLPVLRAGNIQEKLYTEEGLIWIPEDKIKENQKIKENDIVMCTSSGSADLVGKCAKALSNWNGSFGAFCAGIRANPKKVDASYLYHFLCSPMFRSWTKNSSGANIKNIRISELGEFKLPLPPLEEQKRIAAILDKADAIRRKRQQAIKLADDFLRSVFLEMFGDPVTNPKGWDRGVFGDVIEVLTDYHANGSYETLSENVTLLDDPDYAYMVRTTDLERGNFTDNVKYIDRHAYEHLSKSKVFGGEIVINKIGSAGAVYLMPNLGRPVSLAMNQFMIRCNEKSCNQFFYYQLLTNACQREIFKRVQGAVTKTITKDAVRSIPMIMPSFEAQKKFSQIVDKFESGVIRRVKDASTFDQILFRSLSHGAFQGNS